MNIDLLSISGHKMYGPKGIGALYVRKKNPRVKLDSWIKGGGQEMGIRGGTLNVPGIVGLGKAAAICVQEMEKDQVNMLRLKNKISEAILTDRELGATLNGHPNLRLPHNLSFTFKGIKMQTFLAYVHQEVALSTGSTCSSELAEPSHVLKAIGLTDEQAKSTLRIGLGRFNNEEEIDHASKKIKESILRAKG